MRYLRSQSPLALVVAALAISIAVVALVRQPQAGPVGARGRQGATGAQGARGLRGEQGEAGLDATDNGDEIAKLEDTAAYLCASLSSGARSQAEVDFAERVARRRQAIAEAERKAKATNAEYARRAAKARAQHKHVPPPVFYVIPLPPVTRGYC
jgi:hypothetical protein